MGQSFDPRDELAAGGMPMVCNQAWSSPLKSIERQTNGLGIEFGVVQERQLAEPPELAVAAGEIASEPVWYVNTNEPLPTARVEDDSMERAERRPAW